jgi:tyrosine-protein kinase Etk/Wzc
MTSRMAELEHDPPVIFHPPLTPLAVLRRDAPRILIDSAVAVALIVAGSFLIPNRFTAATIILPPHSSGDLFGAVLGIPDVSSISRSLGLESSGETSLYLGILRSGTVKGALIRQFDLSSVYRTKDADKIAKNLTSSTAISLTGEGLIRVAVTDRNPQRAADLANGYADELDRVLQSNSNASARRRREFLEQRVAESRAEVTKAENALRDYQIRTKLPVAGLESERSGEAVADLMAQRTQREVELGTLESVSRTPLPRAEELRNEIRQIEDQVVKLPPATTELARLVRELKIQEKVLLVLSEEYERARIMEQKDVQVIEILDRAGPPIHKSFPRRLIIGAAALLLVLGARSTLAVLRERAVRSR